ncbi:archaetidylserine decarboxylase [Erythrobacter sanguineus]|uniref:Phosphatidylserine decarboxylase proenzyme n=1 Tax=Erythrobacter sanguineus TaxID=198312 RepID=A0A1M7RXA9_9SPHN|nr:archaetidylserine decarboxylase [Erythrobacter sanguineus]SHN50774.1 phosphatidylserine decarboxylase [Erythrobacter sanguineus]
MPSPFVLLQHALPQHLLSRWAGGAAASERPWLRDRLIRRFARSYGVDMADAVRGFDQFASFNDFFTRELKPGARPLADASRFILSPADGAISQLGTITQGRIFQAKGRDFTAAEILGHGADIASRFEGGQFITIYLSPRDYHRVHMPAAGSLRSTAYIPGDLFSVNQQTAEGVDRLFARNERLACLFDGADAQFASVMVGAMIVAGIDTVWTHRFSGHGRRVLLEDFDGADVSLDAGAEMGRFYLGSTVVLLFEPGRVEWLEELAPGDNVRMGAAIGRRLLP